MSRSVASHALLNELSNISRQNLAEAKHFLTLSEREINTRSSPKSWSALECLAHLLIDGDFYHQRIEHALQSTTAAAHYFVPGFWGELTVKQLKPRAKSRKLPTLPSFNTLGSELTKETIQTYIAHQQHLLELLKKAAEADLNKLKIDTFLGSWHKLKLGDILRCVVYHNQRHMQQAQRAVASAESA